MEKNRLLYSLSFPRMIGLIIHYFLGYLFLYPIIASWISLFLVPSTKIILPWLQIAIYVFTAVFALYLAWPAFYASYRRFIEKKKKSIIWCVVLVVTIMIVNIGTSLIISLLTKTNDSVNQQEIVKVLVMFPLITLLSTCIFSPITEELVFRAGVFSHLRGKHSFIFSALISSILFGAIHILSSLFAGNYVDVTYVFVYAAMGMVLAFAYEKTDSVLISMFIHMLNNILSFI